MKINGLDSDQFPPIAFVDVDGVIFQEGTDTFLTGAQEALRRLAAEYRIVLFTSRGPGSWLGPIQQTVPIYGLLPKPLGCAYAYFEDRLVGAGNELPFPSPVVRSVGPWE